MTNEFWLKMGFLLSLLPATAFGQSLPDSLTKAQTLRNEQINEMARRKFEVMVSGANLKSGSYEVIVDATIFCDASRVLEGRPEIPLKRVNVPRPNVKRSDIQNDSSVAAVVGFSEEEFKLTVVTNVQFDDMNDKLSRLSLACNDGPSYGVVVRIQNKDTGEDVGQTYFVEEAFGLPSWDVDFRQMSSGAQFHISSRGAHRDN